jgi:beta-lactamase regulating signal transducer with metallopeptidase domain/HEAT repeat protein
MNRLIESFLPAAAGSTVFASLVEGAIKGTAVLAVAALLAFVLQRTSAARRHLIWACALGMLALMPALVQILPAWKVQAPAVAWMSPVESTRASAGAGSALDVADDLGAHASTAPSDVPGPAASDPGTDPAAASPPAAPAGPPAAEQAAPTPIDMRTLAVAVWALGALLVIAVFMIGHLVLRGLSRDARRLRTGEWHDLALEAADQLRLSLPFALLQGRGVPVPVAFGLLRPRVLLPPEADEWPVERRRAVLLHELAHVQRHDCLTQAVAQLACALFWFHPAVWWAAARLRVERERACDDRVLASRTRASDYADHLLEVVRSLRATRLAALGAVSFAKKSSLEGRLIAVLDPARDRRAVRLRNTIPAAALAALMVLPLAALEPSRAQAGSKHAQKAHKSRPADPAEARPSRVERPANAGASLEAGVDWARSEARRAGDRDWWIGWRIGTSPRMRGGLLGDTGPIHLDMLSVPGHFTLDDVLAGREEGTSSGTYSRDEPHPTALLVRMSGGSLTRVRAQSFHLPVAFAREPLYWLDAIPAEQTFAWLEDEAARTDDVRLRAQLVESAGYLDRSDLVLPFLHATLDGNDASEVRAGAAEAIGRHPSDEGLRLLVEHARQDRSGEVRRASVEALGYFQTPQALEALIALARAGDEGTRRQAFDVMSEKVARQAGDDEKRHQEKARYAEKMAEMDADQDLASKEWDAGPPDEPSVPMDPNEHEVKRQAIEALGRYPESQSLLRLKQIAETSPNADLRREAVESIGRIGTPAAIDVLHRVVWMNRMAEARMTAVEMLARVLPPEEALDQLETIVKSHPSMDTRRVAVESVGRVDGKRAEQILVATIRRGADPEPQRQAVESLGRREGDGIDDTLLEIARSHPVLDVRRQAVETIGRRGTPDVIERLLSVARDDGPEDVRRQAAESIGRLDDPRVKEVLHELAWRGTSSEVMRQAVESLGRIDEDAMADLAEIARSHPSGDVRRQAVETMTRRDPDRALPILERILKEPQRRGDS